MHLQGWTIRASRISAALLSVAAFTAAVNAEAQPAYRGAQVKLASDSSLDIFKDHVLFLSTQDRYDAVLGYLATTVRFGKLKFADADGTKTSRVSQRAAVSMGGGYGEPSKWGFFVGATEDLVMIGPESDSSMQGLLFGGVALLGFQATYSAFVGSSLEGVDAYGNFRPKSSKYVSIEEATFIPGKEDNSTVFDRPTDAFSFYHTSGASLVLIRRRTPGSHSDHYIAETRAQLQPLKPWLEKHFGLPMVALQRLRSEVDTFRDPKAALSSVGTSESDDKSASESQSKPTEVELGSDDLLGLGIRVHALTRVAPSVKFLRAEAGAYHDFDKATFAFRSFLLSRGDSLTGSLELYGQYRIISPGKKSVGFPIAIAGSYSYNSPEAETFVPLPYAHVFGVQVILGVPEVAKPLVPIVRRKEERPRDGDDAQGEEP